MRIIALIGWVGFLVLSIQSLSLFDLTGSYRTRLALAKSFEETAMKCLADVTEYKLNYSVSKACSSLGALSLAYGAASGGEIEKNLPHVIYLDGLSTAWMSVAHSNAFHGTKIISPW